MEISETAGEEGNTKCKIAHKSDLSPAVLRVQSSSPVRLVTQQEFERAGRKTLDKAIEYNAIR